MSAKPLTTRLFLLSLASLVASIATPATAQSSPIEQVNAFYASIPEARRSDLVVLPLVAQMDAAPAGAETIEQARMLHTDSVYWADAAAWAAGEAQQAVLEALGEVTDEPDARFGMAIGLPYGVEALSASEAGIDLIANEMYVELDIGGAPLLAGARFFYLDRLESVAALAHVEATRQLAEGNPRAAVEVLVNWLQFTRQIADREFYHEKTVGMLMMRDALERIRDVLYQDFRGDRGLAQEREFLGEVLVTIPERLTRTSLGALSIDRIAFPRADRIAASQLARFVLNASGANARTWATTMAGLASDGNPLLLFNIAPTMDAAGQFQAPLSDALAAIERVFGDFQYRWEFPDPYDPAVQTRLDIDRLPLGRYVVLAPYTGFGDLLDMRQVLRAEAIGTRQAIAMLALTYRTNQFPTSLAGTRNRDWYPELEVDPFAEGSAPLGYLVPERDTQGVLRMSIVADEANFGREFRSDEFVIFSIGTDRQSNLAGEVQNTFEEVFGADYLLWPPLLSLTRDELKRRGELP